MAKKRSTKKQKAKAKEEPKPQQRVVNINPDLEIEEQIPLNELPTIFPNSYEVVVAAARRARQLNLGLKPLVRTKMQRPVDVALAELAAKKVEYAVDEDELKFDDTPPKRKSRSKTT